MAVSHVGELAAGQIAVDGVGNDEVAVGQALHQGAGPQAVGAVVGEVGLPQDEQAGDGAHQVVIHPQPAHGVVRGRVDHHRRLIRVFGHDLFIHLEEVAVPGRDLRLAQALDGVGEIEIDRPSGGADALAVVAHALGGPGGDIPGGQVAEAGVHALQVVIPLAFGDVFRPPGVAALLGHPDPAVVAQALAHQGELGLVVAVHRDAGGMNLGVARVGKPRALLISPVGRGDVAAHAVGGEIKDIGVAAGGQDHGVGRVPFDLPGDQVAHHDAPGLAVHQHQVQHLPAGEHRHLAPGHLAHQGAIGPQQELLAGLAPGVKGPGDLGAAEGAVGQQAAVFPGKGDALGHAMVDDQVATPGPGDRRWPPGPGSRRP